MEQNERRQITEHFLSMPLTGADAILEQFSRLPNAVTGHGKQPMERYVYVPGTREDRVLLVAHADTVWDSNYGKPAQTSLVREGDLYRGSDPGCGIGADDRAGCAMLWALKDSGHSLLVVDGEEKGKHGAKYLRSSNRRLFRQLNRHRFMIELDWQGTGGCLYNQVDNTEAFKKYIADRLGFQDDKAKGGCDLQILCQSVCGVNIGVGYHMYHQPGETLDFAQWENTYAQLSRFLQEPQKHFPIPMRKQILALLRRGKSLIGSMLRKLRLIPPPKP